MCICVGAYVIRDPVTPARAICLLLPLTNAALFLVVVSSFSGLKSLGVRDLTYRMVFMACSVTQTKPQVSVESASLWFRSFCFRGTIF